MVQHVFGVNIFIYTYVYIYININYIWLKKYWFTNLTKSEFWFFEKKNPLTIIVVVRHDVSEVVMTHPHI